LHVELLMSLLAGAAGGLVGTLWGGLVTGPLLLETPQWRPTGWQPETGARLLLSAALYGVCGAFAGFVFWLSWGLAALPHLPWFELGAVYGALIWVAAALPPLGALAVRLRQPARALGLMALESLVASLSVGALCAYAWQRVV
jgi:hypothetical protein